MSNNAFITRWSNLTPMGVLITRLEVALAGLFLFAAYHKIGEQNSPTVFANSVKAFKVFDTSAASGELGVRLATSVTPWVEAVAAALLLLGIWARAAASVLALMLVVFIALIYRAIVNELDLKCGCFGEMSPFCSEKVGWCNIIQNTIMLAAALLIALTPRSMLARTARPA